MSNALKTALGIVGIVVATQAAAQVTLYSREDFRGESFTADRDIRDMERRGFNDFASSAVVRGGDWQVCEDAGFEGLEEYTVLCRRTVHLVKEAKAVPAVAHTNFA